jgi:putative membrane protein
MPTFAQVILFAQDSDWGHMDMDFDNGWWIVMMIGMVLFWGLVILAAVWLVRELTRRPRLDGGQRGEGDAVEILDRRLAEGDITIQEYEKRRSALKRSS